MIHEVRNRKQYANYDNDELSNDMKAILDERLQEDQKYEHARKIL
jgi:hypothetical protein